MLAHRKPPLRLIRRFSRSAEKRVQRRRKALEGRLADQAALTGVMNTLYELHLPVLSVDCLEADGKEEGG